MLGREAREREVAERVGERLRCGASSSVQPRRVEGEGEPLSWDGAGRRTGSGRGLAGKISSSL